MRDWTRPLCIHCTVQTYSTKQHYEKLLGRAHKHTLCSPSALPSIYSLPRLGTPEDTSLPIPFSILTDIGNGLCLPLNNLPEDAQHFVGSFDHCTPIRWFQGTVNDSSKISFLSFNCHLRVQDHAGMFPPQCITCTAYTEAYLLPFCPLTQFCRVPLYVL